MGSLSNSLYFLFLKACSNGKCRILTFCSGEGGEEWKKSISPLPPPVSAWAAKEL